LNKASSLKISAAKVAWGTSVAPNTLTAVPKLSKALFLISRLRIEGILFYLALATLNNQHY
jgi:hypothetical protein